MSDWPKRHWEENGGEIQHTEVIPADLGQQLYKALRVEFDADEKEWREESAIALDRYKRLVGE